MSIKPIEIKVDDKWKFGEVAFLVDREDFLEDIAKARKLLGIKKLIPNTEIAINKWKGEEQNEALKAQLIKELSTVTRSQKIKDKLLKKYHKPLFFANILDAVILCGNVTDKDFSTTAYVQIIDPMDYIERHKHRKFLGYPRIAIIISPETKLSEVKEVFRKNVPSEMDYFKNEYLNSKSKLHSTISNIKRDRRWYWENKNGNSAAKICEKSDLNIDQKSVEKAITQYKKHLQIAI